MTHACNDPLPERELELALLVGGDLSAEEAAPIEAHLAACAGCRSFAERLRESHEGFATLADEPVDPEALARIRQAVHRRIEAETPRRERRPVWALALAAGLVLASIAAAVWLRGGDPDGGSPAPPPAERVAEAPTEPPPEPPDEPTAPRAEETPPTPEPQPPVRQAAADPPDPSAPATAGATESMVIQVVSDDPDIVFYWLVEPEEPEDETVPS